MIEVHVTDLLFIVLFRNLSALSYEELK